MGGSPSPKIGRPVRSLARIMRTGNRTFPVRFFCYPSGKYDALCAQVLASAGYWGAVTVNPGVEHRSDQMFALERVRVHGDSRASALTSYLDALLSTPTATPSSCASRVETIPAPPTGTPMAAPIGLSHAEPHYPQTVPAPPTPSRTPTATASLEVTRAL